MSYSDLYRQIVREENRDKIITILKENRCWDSFKILNMEVRESQPYPYLYLELDVFGGFAAEFLGMFVDIRPQFPDYKEDLFYLPAVACPAQYPGNLKKYVNKEVSIAHELLHISDIIGFIEKDPDYLDDVLRYGFENIDGSGELLEKSIDFEVCKNFQIEPRALGNDFDQGENLILQPFMLGMVMKYGCETKDEYIRLQMSCYISDLKAMYKERFPDHREDIETHFITAVNRYGKDVFGEEPYGRLLQLKEGLVDKMLKYETSGLKRAEKEKE